MKQYTIRPETPADYRETENLIRESFWNVYRPGCSEHYVMHVLRSDSAFVKELDFVMEQDGRLIGQNMFMRTVIEADDGRIIPVLTMGPICIAPERKRQGYGKALFKRLAQIAVERNYGRIEWRCLNWNEPSIEFYYSLGAIGLDEWTTFRLAGDAIPRLATT